MKKLVLVISAMLVLTNAFAQDVFYPGFYLGIKGGASYTVGETPGIFDAKLLSPSAALDLGYQISPVFGLRANISGWQGKGGFPDASVYYGWNYAQAAVDATFDICNLFGFKERVVNPYGFIGVGGVGYFNNGVPADRLSAHDIPWNGFKFSTVAHVGAGIDFNLSDLLALELEYVYNAEADAFNSKKGSYLDHQHQLLAGLKFNFGKAAGKKQAAEAAAAAAAAAAAQAAAAQARADKAPVVVAPEGHHNTHDGPDESGSQAPHRQLPEAELLPELVGLHHRESLDNQRQALHAENGTEFRHRIETRDRRSAGEENPVEHDGRRQIPPEDRREVDVRGILLLDERRAEPGRHEYARHGNKDLKHTDDAKIRWHQQARQDQVRHEAQGHRPEPADTRPDHS